MESDLDETSLMDIYEYGRNAEFVEDPLTVVVVLLEKFHKVAGAERCRCLCIFADDTGVMRGVCYKKPRFKQGDTVTLFNYNIEDERIVFHKTSRSIREKKSMYIPSIFYDAAEKMMYSPVTIPNSIENIISGYHKTRVTFEGKIIHIDGPKVINPAHGKTDVKVLTCADKTGTVRVQLWNYCAGIPFECGETVLVKDGRTSYSSYYAEMTVSINHPDEIEVL